MGRSKVHRTDLLRLIRYNASQYQTQKKLKKKEKKNEK